MAEVHDWPAYSLEAEGITTLDVRSNREIVLAIRPETGFFDLTLSGVHKSGLQFYVVDREGKELLGTRTQPLSLSHRDTSMVVYLVRSDRHVSMAKARSVDTPDYKPDEIISVGSEMYNEILDRANVGRAIDIARQDLWRKKELRHIKAASQEVVSHLGINPDDREERVNVVTKDDPELQDLLTQFKETKIITQEFLNMRRLEQAFSKYTNGWLNSFPLVELQDETSTTAANTRLVEVTSTMKLHLASGSAPDDNYAVTIAILFFFAAADATISVREDYKPSVRLFNTASSTLPRTRLMDPSLQSARLYAITFTDPREGLINDGVLKLEEVLNINGRILAVTEDTNDSFGPAPLIHAHDHESGLSFRVPCAVGGPLVTTLGQAEYVGVLDF